MLWAAAVGAALTVSFTSLGLGDVCPHGPARLLTGIEALNGLLLIGWSPMFTYPALQASCKVTSSRD